MITTRDGAHVYRKIIEANDSCLFNSLGYAFYASRELAPKLRKFVADKILADPINFNHAILGRNPKDYSAWIQTSTSWGGAIEMMILSEYFKSEIVAVDTVNVRYDIFGQGKGYSQRVCLIYSGIHYDLCVKNLHPERM